MLTLLSRHPWLIRVPGVQSWLKRRVLKACADKDVPALQACLEAGLPVDVALDDRKLKTGPQPLIFHATDRGFEDGLRVLLGRGADPMSVTPSWDHESTCDHVLMGLTHFGQDPKYPRMARALVEAGACVDASQGWEPNWNKTYADECGDPIGVQEMMSFREAVLMTKYDKPEWQEVLHFADGLMRARGRGAQLEAALPTLREAANVTRRF